MRAAIRFRVMTITDFEAVTSLLKEISGVRLSDADSIGGVSRYLSRNPGMSFVAELDGHLVGCLFGGHDGRRGYLNHLAVSAQYRRQGIATRLVESVVSAVGRDGIQKFHIDLLTGNEEGLRFWLSLGWEERKDLMRLSFIPPGYPATA